MRKYLVYIGIPLLMLTGCSVEEQNMLPNGREPVVLKANVATPTETTRGLTATKGIWTEHDKVAVMIDGVVKIYEATNEDGGVLKVQEEEPFYWTRSTEVKTIKGWFQGDGETTNVVPDTWVMADDQNANDGAGLQESDFLYASPTAVSYVNRFHQKINFYHQTAKIIVRIRNTGAIADNADAIENVTIGDASFPIDMCASFAEPENGYYGEWTLSADETTKGYIQPFETVLADQTTYLKYYEALVMPQDLDFKPLLVITIGGRSYYYVPGSGQAELRPGYVNIYDICVSNDATKLIVTPIVGGAHVWTYQEDGTVDMDDDKSAVLNINGWILEDNPDANVTSGVIPIEFNPNAWTHEDDGETNYEDSQPDDYVGSDGWEKDGDDGTVDEEDNQPDTSTTVSGNDCWTKEGDDENVTSEEE